MQTQSSLAALLAGCERMFDSEGPARALRALVDAGKAELPLPGQGATFLRWQQLAQVAGYDLSLAKLYEGHTDALAILAELGAPAELQQMPHATWGVWAADPPDARVLLAPRPPGLPLAPAAAAMPDAPLSHAMPVLLNGRKAWCSGASGLSHALLTARDSAGNGLLVAVALADPGVRVDTSPWQAVGMAGSASADVSFENVPGVVIGAAGAYLDRPGFWHGGAGVAACWYGAAATIAHLMRGRFAHAHDPHYLAHLGAVDVALGGARTALAARAAAIDAAPTSPFMREVMRVRLQVEAAATEVMQHAGRALGAGPLCRERQFARLMADLPVFLRQSHAEQDLASLGRQVLAGEAAPWTL